MNKHFSLFAVLSLAGLLTACSPFGPVSDVPIKTYTLNSLAVTPSPEKQTNQSLTVMPVNSTRGFDSTAMVYEAQPYLLSSFAQNAWIAPPASMITNLLVTALHQSAAFSAVVAGPSLSNTDYIVNVTLLSLYQDFMVKPSQIVLSLDVSLINAKTNAIIRDQIFNVQVPATEESPYGGVVAANKAVSMILNEITQYLITAIAENQA